MANQEQLAILKQDEQVFGQMFVKLLDGLQLFYKG